MSSAGERDHEDESLTLQNVSDRCMYILVYIRVAQLSMSPFFIARRIPPAVRLFPLCHRPNMLLHDIFIRSFYWNTHVEQTIMSADFIASSDTRGAHTSTSRSKSQIVKEEKKNAKSATATTSRTAADRFV